MGGSSKPIVLVVDDEESFRDLARVLLQPIECEFAGVGDAVTGLAELARRKIHMLIADLVMPGKEGIAMIREARRSHPGLKILAVSGALGGTQYLHAASKLGADATLDKAEVRMRLAPIVQGLLRSRAAQTL